MSARYSDGDEDDLGPPNRLQSFFASRNSAVTEEPPGIFEDPQSVAGGKRRKPWLAIAFVLIVIPAFGAMLWYAYSWSEGGVDLATLPVIVAQDDPIKVKPENEGGMEVPYQDKLILNQMAEAGDARVVEHLLEEPEAPAVIVLPEEMEAEDEPALETAAGPRSEAEAGEDAIAALIDSAQGGAADEGAAVAAVEEAPPPPVEPEPAVSEARAPEPAVTETPAVPEAPVAEAQVAEVPVPEVPIEEPEPAPAPKPAQQAAIPAGGGYKLQLAAVKSNASAVAEWDRLQQAHQGLLGPLTLIVEKAVVNGVTYHRVQAGPLADRAAAEGLCSKLKAANQPCIFKRIR